MAHIMNELIDEACGRVLARVAARGWDADTDVFFTTDHGELQGDYGLDLQGPVPHRLVDAAADGVAPRAVGRRHGRRRGAASPSVSSTSRRRSARSPASPQPDWMQGAPLPTAPGSRSRARAVRVGLAVPRLRHAPALDLPRRLAVHRVRAVDGRRAERSRGVVRHDRHVRRRDRAASARLRTTAPKASSTTSTNDPHQWENRWDDPAVQGVARGPRRRPLRRALPEAARTRSEGGSGPLTSGRRGKTPQVCGLRRDRAEVAVSRPTGERARSRSRRRCATPRSLAAPTTSPGTRRTGCRSRVTAP